MHGHGVRRINSNTLGRHQFKWRGAKCDFVNNGRVFIAKGPSEIVLNDWLGEDHVGLCILYCPVIMSIVMTLMKWLLGQTILDGYPFKEYFITFNETHILDVDDVGVVGVKKKKSFHKRKRNVANFEGSISKIGKVLN